MENQIQSRKFMYIKARTWSNTIGWAQTNAGAINLVLITYWFLGQNDKSAEVEAKVKTDNGNLIFVMIKENEKALLTSVKSMGVVRFQNAFIQLAILLASGIMLLLGVKQKNAGILKIWQMFQTCFLVFAAYGAVSSISAEEYREGVIAFILIIGTIFAICVVDLHRKELNNAENAEPKKVSLKV